MGWWTDRVFPLSYDRFLWLAERLAMRRLRTEVLAGAHGRVLEVGAGTGLNLSRYPDGLRELVLTEPDERMASRLRRRVGHSGRSAQVLIAAAERLPFEDGSFDCVVATLVLCTVADLERSLAELRRVTARGGRLLFVEHVRAASGSLLGRWQDRLHDPWFALAAGCHCNRQTLGAIERAGFQVQKVRPARWLAMPPIVAPLILGEATA